MDVNFRQGNRRTIARASIVAGAAILMVASCSFLSMPQHWDPAYGPVIPHDTFPADCSLCHTTDNWHQLRSDFSFNHEKETGYALTGAHEDVTCLLCHNDRGPVSTFAARGCAGCHVDVHQGVLGASCADCHNEDTWKPRAAIAQHDKTRFPLVGAHTAVECILCHEGAERGQFSGLDTACASCHMEDVERAAFVNHRAVGFTEDCQQCHTEFEWNTATFNHTATFPLSGAHHTLRCAACHADGNLKSLSTDCAACHLDDFVQVSNPNHQESRFSTNCLECHTATTWNAVNFRHPSTFPLRGGHGGLDCSLCHVQGIAPGLPTDCTACHLDDFQQTTDPDHVTLGFSNECAECHNTSSWSNATFDHPASFPLTKGHRNVDCSQCHVGEIGPIPADCASCHLDEYQGVTDPDHAAANFSMNCTDCHTTQSWSGADFEHPEAFPLTKGHGNLDCSQCHVGGTGPLPTDCISCHRDDYDGVTDPDHVASGFSADCTECHTTDSWQGANFEHPASFPLTLGHGNLDCSQCHVGGTGPIPADCVSCHRDDYENVTDPNHAAAGFSTDCTECHTTESWEGATFSHPTSFPLTKGHGNLDCAQCHMGSIGPIPTDCVSCHRDDYDGVTDPNHVTSNFSTDCTECHTTVSWEGANFVHPASFPLTQGHGNVSCSECHGTSTGPIPADCASCHQDDYDATSDPNHVAAGIPIDCTQCHTTFDWETSTFTHPTSFPLTSGHGGLDCSLCHAGSLGAIPTDCVTCHSDDYQGTIDPNHAAAGFPADCSECHTTASWDDSLFTHPLTFPLVAGHGGLDCSLCHVGQLGDLPTECSTCHLDDYQATTDPNHEAVGFPMDCTDCHSTTTWSSATFIHPTSFPLTGGHGGIDCSQCHAGGVGPLDTDCASCHLDDYQMTTDPNHTATGIPTDCMQCHTTTTWEGALFVHPASFPLAGGHSGLNCSECHMGGVGPLPTDCASCHLDDYQSVTDPNHVTGNFSTDCLECHEITTWEGATFEHPASFPLSAGHNGLDCAECHQGGIGPLPTDCATCHLDDYQGTTNPNHAASGFPMDCTTCHTTSTWQGASFVHPASFPLTAGHGALDCAQCHQGGVGPLPTDCANCHLDDYQATTDPNHPAAGIPTDCMQCHNTTTWDSANFVHPSSFPLTGGHSAPDCAACHQGIIGPLSTDCDACHLDDFQQTTDPNHVSAGFPRDCLECHTTTTWQGATIVHPASFPLTGGHSGLDCSQCHDGGIGPLPTDCVTCHLTDYQQTTDPSHASSGFPTDCTQCHTTTTWQGAVFNHPFPITSGPHRRLECADCHTVPNDFTSFSCTHCHEHRQSEADGEHEDVDNYVWSSPSCLECHPNGRSKSRQSQPAAKFLKRFDPQKLLDNSQRPRPFRDRMISPPRSRLRPFASPPGSSPIMDKPSPDSGPAQGPDMNDILRKIRNRK